MTYAITNHLGKKISLSPRIAKDFFGVTDKAKKVLCLPVSADADLSGETISRLYEVSRVYKKRKIAGTLVIRMGGLGDLILLSSGLRQMDEPVTLATIPEFIPFMKSMKICRVISVEDLGKYTFDKIIDLRFAVEPKEMGGAYRGSWADYTMDDRSDAFDKLLGIYPAKKIFDVPVSPKFDKDQPFAAVNASMWASARSIPPKYIEPLCSKINRVGLGPVFLFGQSQPWNKDLLEIKGKGIINRIDQTTIEEMVSIINLSDLVITPDTGSLHVAGALGKPTIALFGNINPRTRTSYYPSVRALYPQGELPCVPCWDLHPCTNGEPEPTKCMKLLTPSRIVEAARCLI